MLVTLVIRFILAFNMVKFNYVCLNFRLIRFVRSLTFIILTTYISVKIVNKVIITYTWSQIWRFICIVVFPVKSLWIDSKGIVTFSQPVSYRRTCHPVLIERVFFLILLWKVTKLEFKFTFVKLVHIIVALRSFLRVSRLKWCDFNQFFLIKIKPEDICKVLPRHLVLFSADKLRHLYCFDG